MTVGQLAAKLFLLAADGKGEYDVEIEYPGLYPGRPQTYYKEPGEFVVDTYMNKNVVVIK